MKPLTAVITDVGKGEVSIRMSNGFRAKFKTDRDFHYAEKVVVCFDYERFKVRDLKRMNELKQEPLPPQVAEHENSDEREPILEDLESDSSLQLPAVASEERIPEQESESEEPECSLLISESASEEFLSGDELEDVIV